MTTPQQPVTRDMRELQQAIDLLRDRTARLYETMGEIHPEPSLDTKLREWLAFDGWRAEGVIEAVDILIGEAQWQAQGLRTAKLAPVVRDTTKPTDGRTPLEQARVDLEEWRASMLLGWEQLDAGYRALREYVGTEPGSEVAEAALTQISAVTWKQVVRALTMAARRMATKQQERTR